MVPNFNLVVSIEYNPETNQFDTVARCTANVSPQMAYYLGIESLGAIKSAIANYAEAADKRMREAEENGQENLLSKANSIETKKGRPGEYPAALSFCLISAKKYYR